MIEYFPDPHPDELLYSVWARCSDHVGYSARADIHRELFGKKYINAVVDFPCHLDYFVSNLPREHIYTADYFIDYHTLLPLYSPFLPLERVSCIRQQMLKGSAEAIHSRLGIIHCSIPRPQWLRYCPLCVEQDRAAFGECYWHRLHQIPGVDICHLHATYLEFSNVHARRDFTCGEFASAEQIISNTQPRKAGSLPFYKILAAIATDVLYLLDHPQQPMNLDFFHQQYHALLARQGFLGKNGRIRRADFIHAFMDFYSPALLELLHSELNRCKHIGGTWLSRLLRLPSSKGLLHPIQHILTIRFLGSTIESFLNHQIVPPAPFGTGPWPCLNPACENYEQNSIITYELGTHSTAVRPVGVFACTCGFTYIRSGPDHSPDDIFRRDRVASYGAAWETRLCELWLDPTKSVASIARHLGVENHTINCRAAKLGLPFPRETHWTRAQAGVHRYRRSMEDVPIYRAQWLSLLNEMPEAGRSTLQKRLPGVYKWLWTHDREWLRTHLPPKKQPRRYAVTTQLWRSSVQQYKVIQTSKERLAANGEWKNDAEVAKTIREVSYRLVATAEPPERVTLHRISREIPLIRQLRHQIHKAPLTMQAVKEVTESPEDFTIRLIQWLVRKHQEKTIRLTPGTLRERIRKNFPHTFHLPTVQQSLEEALTRLTEA